MSIINNGSTNSRILVLETESVIEISLLQSYDVFAAYVDTLKGTEADKIEIKEQGSILAKLVIHEAEEHAEKHLSATLTDNPEDLEIAARVSQIREYLGTVKTRNG